jgi:hypothetical protein
VVLSSSSCSELREDIHNIIKEWHFGTEYLFDDGDLEDMTSDIMKVISKTRDPFGIKS